MKHTIAKWIRKFWENEDGIGVVEIILILVVLVGLVMIFKTQISSLVSGLLAKVVSQSNKL